MAILWQNKKSKEKSKNNPNDWGFDAEEKTYREQCCSVCSRNRFETAHRCIYTVVIRAGIGWLIMEGRWCWWGGRSYWLSRRRSLLLVLLVNCINTISLKKNYIAVKYLKYLDPFSVKTILKLDCELFLNTQYSYWNPSLSVTRIG